ncbi:MAG: histidine kinase [Paenibacillaceae bacterium]|nr:histidine kinase [Paenibacillaceae bacterium]
MNISNRRYYTIHYKVKLIAAFGLLIILTLASVGTINYVHVRGELEKSSQANLEQTMDQLVSHVELRMTEINKMAIRLAGDTEFQTLTENLPDAPYELRSMIDQRIEFEARNSEIYTVTIMDNEYADTFSELHTPPISEGDSDRWRRTGISAAFLDNRSKWSLEYFQHRNGELIPVMLYSHPIYRIRTYEVKPVGVLQISMSLEWLLNQLDNRKGNNARFAITDGDGRNLLSVAKEELGAPFIPAEEFRRELGLGNSVWRRGGETVTVKHFAGQTWFLTAVKPDHDVIAGANKALRQSLLVAAGIFIFAMGLAVVISHSVTRPILLLCKAMGQLERGMLNTTVEIPGRDEFGYLGKSFNSMAMQIKTLVADNLQIELSRREAELIALQTQINPHFLYNTLSSIDSLASHLKDNRISTISQGLAHMFRYSVSGNAMSSLQEEIRHIELYLSIQKIRFGAKLDFIIDLEEGMEHYEVPKLFLQPLVENSVVHGIEPKAEGGYVNLLARSVSETHLCIEIEDSGTGMPEEQVRALNRMLEEGRSEVKPGSRRSIGLMNVYRRVALLYGSDGEMAIASSEGFGTVIRLVIPKKGMVDHG